MAMVIESTALGALRAEIDTVDQELLRLLSRRLEVCRRIGVLKRSLNVPLVAAKRQAHVLDVVAQHAHACGIDPQFARHLWTLIMEEACRIEDASPPSRA